MSFIGKIDTFDADAEDWPSYIERTEQFFLANEIKEEKKAPVLLSAIGPRTYRLLRSLVAPEKPKDKTYNEIVSALEAHLAPTPQLVPERFRFLECVQKEGESVSQFIASLQKKTEHCQFGTFLNDMLRDKFIQGLNNTTIQQKLLAQAAQDKGKMTFSKACEIALALESANKDCREWSKSHSSASGKVNLVNRPCSSENRNQNRYTDSVKCWRCLKIGHKPQDCWHRKAVCHNCGLQGHVKVACKKDPQSKPSVPPRRSYPRRRNSNYRRGKDNGSKPVKQVDLQESSESDSDFGTPIKSVKENKPKGKNNNDDVIWVSPLVNGNKLQMELDTGACVSLISLADYLKLFKDIPMCKGDATVLRTFSGESINAKGTVKVDVEYGKQKFNLELVVVDVQTPPLFGRSWLKHIKLDWAQIKKVMAGSKELKLNEILSKFDSVFDDQLGTMTNITAHLEIEDGEPKFFRPRPIPYALRQGVENEINRLVANGTLSPVDYSDWATPIVPVVKRDGSIRICGDFNFTVNPLLNIDVYPMPKIEDIFANLSGGKLFSTIDLANAYQQMMVEDESKKYLVINTHKGMFRYNRLPFGIASAPALFQKAIEQILQGIPGVQSYLDDILVTGKTDEDHLSNLESVLKRLSEFGLKIRKKSVNFSNLVYIILDTL